MPYQLDRAGRSTFCWRSRRPLAAQNSEFRRGAWPFLIMMANAKGCDEFYLAEEGLRGAGQLTRAYYLRWA
jgi:hypothetical protein